MTSLELTYAVTAFANAIACALTTNEISLLAGVLVQLSDTLGTIAAQRTLCEEQAEKGQSMFCTLSPDRPRRMTIIRHLYLTTALTISRSEYTILNLGTPEAHTSTTSNQRARWLPTVFSVCQ